MLTILGDVSRYCDGVTRRSFLKVGAFSVRRDHADPRRRLPGRGRAAKDPSPSLAQHKAVINVFLGGGPPHQDMFDLKPDAPAEIRGEFKPIADQRPRHPDLRGLPAARRG